mmetsp:Transcript_11216/g.31068  ORF Transcript_11216/g.31068 Transcript_11216/m.31068 type:complete len:87 (-) Transcript_11216:190-450(-)
MVAFSEWSSEVRAFFSRLWNLKSAAFECDPTSRCEAALHWIEIVFVHPCDPQVGALTLYMWCHVTSQSLALPLFEDNGVPGNSWRS